MVLKIGKSTIRISEKVLESMKQSKKNLKIYVENGKLAVKLV